MKSSTIKKSQIKNTTKKATKNSAISAHQKTVINLKVDRDTKEQAQGISQEMGLPLGTVINGLLRQFVRDREVHLIVAPTPNAATAKRLRAAAADIQAGRNVSPTFSSAKEAEAWLNQQ